MFKKKISIAEIVEFLGDDVIRVEGKAANLWIDNLTDAEHTNKTTLDWISPKKKDKQFIVESSLARVILVDSSVQYTNQLKSDGKVLLVVKNPKIALAKIGNNFFVEYPKPGIHPTSIIHPEAIIGKDVFIGPYCVIGKAHIGDYCIIDSSVRIYDDVTIGHHCSIKAGAVLGGAGFGFEKDEEGNRFRFPQIGGLIIGDYVEIGGNTCIDRGALSDTIIGDYTKINNLCHIAHNNIIGRNVEITGCVNVSGSNIIDDNVWISPNSSIRGYLHIGEGALIGMGAVVTKDVPSHEVWVGNPARKFERK